MRVEFELALVLMLVGVGCGESRREVYAQGMKVEREAEGGPCKLMYDQQMGANVLSGDQVQHCLKLQEEALGLYERAEGMGLKDVDFVQAHERARERVKKLELMLKMVREMETPEFIPGSRPEYPGAKKP